MRLDAYIASRPRIKNAGEKRARISGERNLGRFVQLVGQPLDLDALAWDCLATQLGRYNAGHWAEVPKTGESLARSIQIEIASSRVAVEPKAAPTRGSKASTTKESPPAPADNAAPPTPAEPTASATAEPAPAPSPEK